jgi:hypothetical protein
MSDTAKTSPRRGEKWQANLQPINSTEQQATKTTVTLEDYDARTDTWTVRPEGAHILC